MATRRVINGGALSGVGGGAVRMQPRPMSNLARKAQMRIPNRAEYERLSRTAGTPEHSAAWVRAIKDRAAAGPMPGHGGVGNLAGVAPAVSGRSPAPSPAPRVGPVAAPARSGRRR